MRRPFTVYPPGYLCCTHYHGPCTQTGFTGCFIRLSLQKCICFLSNFYNARTCPQGCQCNFLHMNRIMLSPWKPSSLSVTQTFRFELKFNVFLCQHSTVSQAVCSSITECVCNYLGTVREHCNSSEDCRCEKTTGQCHCLPNVIGQNCDHCAPNTWRLASGTGCELCECDVARSFGPSCNEVRNAWGLISAIQQNTPLHSYWLYSQ